MGLLIFENVMERLQNSFLNVDILTKTIEYDSDLNPRIIDPDPFTSFKDIDEFPTVPEFFIQRLEVDTMNGEDEPLSGLNGRLRPRKSAAPSPQANKPIRKSENKPALDRPKRTSTPSKAAATKTDDLANKSDLSTAPQLLCPYCDRKFASKQTVSKHARRIHLSYSKQDSFIDCLFCAHSEADNSDIIRHMVDSHPNQYFACLDCHTRFFTPSELAEHKLNVCEKQKEKLYRSKLRQKVSSGSKKNQNTLINLADDKEFSSGNKVFPDGHCFNGVVISCELKPAQVNDEADIEDNITTNLILPPSKNLGTNSVIEKNAVIVLDDIQWNKRMPTNFSFHNTDADQILSRLGVVHRSPRTGESTKKDWYKNAEEAVQKFEKCFDTGFYSKVASNVHDNLAKFLDGSFNFNPDPDSIIKTRKSKQSVVINTAEGFPILLAFQQFSRNVFDGYMPRTLAPKHKWKWENDKNPLIPDDIKRDNHVNNCIITLVSSLDIWTQLCMRRKFEEKFRIPPLEKKTEKLNIISKELKEILESRELPTSSQQPTKYISKPMPSGDSLDFPASLGLKPSAPTYDMQPAVLSGEWVRPRCYVCCACGAQTRDSRGLSSHISTQHPNAQVQHYEIVGELLLNADILKHLYVPPSQMCNRTRPLRGFRECTKCKKSISLEDLHQHMLDCAGDTPTVRRKCRYRPFGVRRRRPRLPDNTIRKKIRKDIRSRQTRQKTLMRPRPKIRSEVGDAETIRKMLADLPAKRHRVMVNPMNQILRPRRKIDKQRNTIIMKRRSTEIARNRKQREIKKGSMSNSSRSNNGENDENDNKSNKSDDENKPLKPKIKRVLTHGPRSSESLKRKVALNRAKRRVRLKEQRLTEDSTEQQQPTDMSADGAGGSGINGDNLSTDNPPQRIDVNGGPYNTREQSGRGSQSNNNRDSRDSEQLPGSSGSQNGNLNNSSGPVHNAPLKHSIARLTGDTEMHDRSMQYRHLYLMQPPGCTGLDLSQHVPSGQQRVFENEAVVRKLDKPPLHFNLPPPLDVYADHKNKQLKPKKGLNYCIELLRKKVYPTPDKRSIAVQCGSEDSLDSENVATNQASSSEESPGNVDEKPPEQSSRPSIPETNEQPHSFPEDCEGETASDDQNFAELPFHPIGIRSVATQTIPIIPPPSETRVDPNPAISSKKQKEAEKTEIPNKKETAPRRRSTRSDKGSVPQDPNVLTPPGANPTNTSTPAKVNVAQGRRSSSQSGTVVPNTTARRRSSASINRSNAAKHLTEYEMAGLMAQQRPLEFYHAQGISPETLLRDVNIAETYNQAQINKQNQMMNNQRYAKQMMLENYVKNQLSVCVDTNYSNKTLNAGFSERVYANSKHLSVSPGNHRKGHSTGSPGNKYESGKQLSVSPGNRYDSSIHQSVSPGSRYDHANNPADKRYENTMHLMTIPCSGYDNNKYGLDSSLNNYGNSKHLTVSPASKQDGSKHTTLSPGSNFDGKKVLATSPGSRHDHAKLLAGNPAHMYENSKQGAISPGNQYDHNKRTDIGASGRYEVSQHAISSGNLYDSTRKVTTGSDDASKNNASYSERQYDREPVMTMPNSICLEGPFDKSKPAVISPNSHYGTNQHVPNTPLANYSASIYENFVSEKQCDSSKHISPRSHTDISDSTSFSPGRQFDNRVKYLPVCSESQLNSMQHLNISPRTSYDASKHGALLSSEGVYDIRKPLTRSPGSLIDSTNPTGVNPETLYGYNQYANISPRSFDTSKTGQFLEGSDRHYDIRQHINPMNPIVHSNSASVIPGNPFDGRKYGAIKEAQIGSSQLAPIFLQSNYESIKQGILGRNTHSQVHQHITVSPPRQIDNCTLSAVSAGFDITNAASNENQSENSPRGVISPRHNYDTINHGVLFEHNHQQVSHSAAVKQYENHKFTAVSSENSASAAVIHHQHLINISGNYPDEVRLAASIPTRHYDHMKHISVNPVRQREKQIYDNPRKHLDALKVATKSPESNYDKDKHTTRHYESHYDNQLENDKHNNMVPETSYEKNEHISAVPGNAIVTNSVVNLNTVDNSTCAKSSTAVDDDDIKYAAIEFEVLKSKCATSSENQLDKNKHNIVHSGRNHEDSKRGAVTESINHGMPSSHFDNSQYPNLSSENNIKQIAIRSELTSNNSLQTAVSSLKQVDNNKQQIINTEKVPGNNENSLASSASHYDTNKQYITKKQAAVAADSHHNNNKHTGTTLETHYINKKQAASTENNYPKKNSFPERFYTKSYDSTSSEANNSFTKKTNYDESTFVSKKSQAVAIESKLLNKTQVNSCAKISNTDKSLSCTDKLIKEAQANAENSKSLSINRIEDTLNTRKQDSVDSSLYVKPTTDVCIETIETNTVDKNIGPSSSSSHITYKDLEMSTDNFIRKQDVRCREINNMNKNLTDVLPEGHLISRKMSAEYYRENRYIRAILPPPFADLNSMRISQNVDFAPLNLSKTTLKDTIVLLKDDDKNEEYETLDLSHKISAKPNEIPIADMKIASLSLRTGNVNYTPSELTNKRKYYVNRDLNTVVPEEKVTVTKIYSESIVQSDLPTGTKFDCELENSLDNVSDRIIRGLHASLPDDRAQIGPGSSETSMQPLLPLRKEFDMEKVRYDNCEQRMPVGGLLTSNAVYAAQNMQYTAQPPITSANIFYDETSNSPRSYISSDLMNDNSISVDDNTFATTASKSIPFVVDPTFTEVDVPVPLYSLSNSVTSIMMSKYESTTPVYTLANACISMAKEEPSTLGPSSDAFLSTPSTAIVSVAPFYTLTDTTVKPSMNFITTHQPSQDSSSAVSSKPCVIDNVERQEVGEGRGVSAAYQSASTESFDEHSRKTDNPSSYSELDPETAKKIAMLPKELVEILGTMPVDHRNQLLNVLPQYVSTSTSTLQNDNPNISTASLVHRGVSPPRISDFDVKPSIGYSPVSSSQTMRTVTSMISSVERFDESKSFPLYQATESKSLGEVAKYEPSEQMTKVYEINGNTVIDLTEDDVPQNNEVKQAVEQPKDSVIKISDPVSTPNTKSNKQKNNDQTASLRAVRIKAPSERNKSVSNENMPIIKSNVEQVKSNVEVPKHRSIPLDLDKTLAIQQAEISSTQHNTTIAGNCKYPLAISPSSAEYSGDESIKPVSQPSPKESTEIVTEKLLEPPVPKTGMVSSSISTSEENPRDVGNNTIDICLAQAKDLANKTDLATTDELSEISTDKMTSECKLLGQTETLEQHEDSDDDISLATIVKQKQRGQNIITIVAKKTNRKGSKKKKKKKGKKLAKKTPKISLEDINTSEVKTSKAGEVISSACLDNILVKLNDDVIHKEENHVNMKIANCTEAISNLHSKHRKKASKRGKVDVLTVTEIQKLDCISVENEKDINKENNRTSERVNKFNAEDNNSANVYIQAEIEVSKEPEVNKVKINQKINKDIAADPVIKLSKCDDKLSAYSVKITKDLSQAKETRKAELLKVDGKELDHRVPPEDIEFSTLESDTNNSNEAITEHNKNDVASAHTTITEPEQENNNIIESVDTKKSKKAVRYKNTNVGYISKFEEEVESLENVVNTIDTKDNKTTPLRRSTRGKSLFLEGTLEDEDPAELCEVNIEHKTPLTKKQLIFSKLLLDEENPRPEKHSTPEKHDKNVFNLIVDDKADEVPEISDVENVDEILSEKVKGTKRRINAQLPNKSKKKKSFEELSTSTECATKSQTEDNTVENTNPSFKLDESSSLIKNINKLKSDDKNDSIMIKTKVLEVYNSKNNNNNDKKTICTEKRKHNNQISFDLSQSSKPKKCKMTKIDNTDTDTDRQNCENSSKVVDSLKNTSETKTACYNLPMPARRARSKSVVVKSSTYDPYDIDLEDMAEQSEMFRRKDINSDYISKTNKTFKSANHTNKENNKVAKADRKESRVTAIAFSKNVLDHTNDEYEKGTACDSDDSSKSDVPLKKYVEEKEKKIQEIATSLFKETKSPMDNQQNLDKKDTKRITSSDVQKNTQTKAEEELRSEQFMESFGFFSERKPRKSNLLATKKISETFHINNESDDMFFGFKERTGKRNSNVDSKKSVDHYTTRTHAHTWKRTAPKRGRKKRGITKIMPCYCNVCKKEFRRSDNNLRHQMSLAHIIKLSEVELKVKIIPGHHEEPNYLVAYKQYLDRLKKLTDILVQKKKKYPKAASKIVLPTRAQILADVNKKVRDQQRCGLSRDEELFLDCCELLRESHVLGARGRYGLSGLDILEKALNDLDTNEYISDDGDCDSITAQNILESEEVRNLENDLISGLKEAANATRNANIEYQHSLNEFAAPQVVQMVQLEQAQQAAELEQANVDNQVIQNTQEVQSEELSEVFSSPNARDSQYEQIEDYGVPAKPRSSKVKKHIEVKEKMYPDILIEDIDMFEDKFDKIKRKCRSQAAAAKQIQPVVDQTISHKVRKKSEKKKGKRSSKKARHQSTHVPTKGALKGFDGIKVSIPTSEINISAIVPVSESSVKKKKKSSTKKKRDKRDSESSSKYDSDHRGKDNSANYKKVDVYEFMDNEDAELFEFRASTLMERFKSISNNKDLPTSKFNPVVEENSSQESASDGDDFVYMSDDYVASGDDETENSLLSCELGNGKLGNDIKKNSPQKRKDVVEKNAVMGKIFKHNAVRAEKKVILPKEPEKPKANLDQLFDSLLEDEPNSSELNNEAGSPKGDDFTLNKKYIQSSSKINVPRNSYDQTSDSDIFAYPNKYRSSSPGKTDGVQSSTPLSKIQSTTPPKDYISIPKKREISTSKKLNLVEADYGPSTSKNFISTLDPIDYGPSTSKKYNNIPKEDKKSSPKSSTALHKSEEKSHKNKKRNDSTSSKNDVVMFNTYDDDLPSNKPDEGISTSYDYSVEAYDQSMLEDETGVARQRARRKCTVGKQNVLAETWSSESEPDGGPPRPNSAESDISGVNRKKKAKRKEGQQAVGRRGNNRQVAFKKQDLESRVSCNRASSSALTSAGSSNVPDDDPGEGTSGMCSVRSGGSVTGNLGGNSAGDTAAAAAAAAAAMPAPSTAAVAGPSNIKGRPRTGTYYWSSEGDDEQEHLQQHGWIVGDSHKKLVTMLAHAKGRKRNNDDKRHLVE